MAKNAGKSLFLGHCDFVAGAMNSPALPPMTLPEVAFAGRSNVGKSSLLNALTGRNSLARTSQTPGRTRQLNFFNLGDRLMLVDLPGYGYAKASKKDIKSWTDLTKDYLCGRANLRRTCLLIDSRRGLGEVDIEYMKMLDESAVPYQIILTKADKLKKSEEEKLLAKTQEIIAKHPAAMPSVMLVSSLKGINIDKVRDELTLLTQS